MKEKIEQVRLADIVIDLSIRTREPEAFTISAYRQALRAGSKFPPLVIERGTNRLVCGHHRYGMYRAEYEPTETVSCVKETYAGELDLWKRAVSDNTTHGRPLDTWDKKRILLKMVELGAAKEEVASLLGVTIERTEEWGDQMVVVRGQRGGQSYEELRPIKHGQEGQAGKVYTDDEYQRYIANGTGVEARRHAKAIIDYIKGDAIDRSDERTMALLHLLQQKLGDFLAGESVAA